MRHLTAIAGFTLAGGALAATTCFMAIPDLEEGPAGGSDAAVGGGTDGGGTASGLGATGGDAGGFGAGGAGGTLPSYRDVVLSDQPIGYWRLDETDGGTAYDEVQGYPGPHDGTYTGVVLGVDGALMEEANKAAHFDEESILDLGITQEVFDFPAQNWFSIEGWFRRKSNDGWERRLLSKEVPVNEPAWTGYGLHSTDQELTFFRVQLTDVESVSTSPLPADEFTHVVATYDDEREMRLYVNGELVAGPVESGHYLSNNWGLFGVGVPKSTATQSLYRFVGDIDELAVYDSVLRDDQILEHYQAGTR